jgi:hypothetical protein
MSIQHVSVNIFLKLELDGNKSLNLMPNSALFLEKETKTVTPSQKC